MRFDDDEARGSDEWIHKYCYADDNDGPSLEEMMVYVDEYCRLTYQEKPVSPSGYRKMYRSITND
jgi:hypothetical protein